MTAKSLQNVYLEFRPEGEKVRICAFGTPGLDAPIVGFGDTPIRGKPLAFEPGNLAFEVHRGFLWEINNAGVKTNRGTLNTTNGTVFLAHNGTQVMVVDGVNGYIYNTVTNVFAVITDPDFPSMPLTVTFLDGYFIVNKGLTGQYNISDLYNGLAWDGLDFAVAESNPDVLKRVIADHGQLVLLGDKTIEFWSNTGAQDFPFERIQGSTIEWGVGAVNSLEKLDNSLAFLAANSEGQYQVVRLSGFTPQRISTSDLEFEINSYQVATDATAYSYLQDGHHMYQLNFPSAVKSWLFDSSTGAWSSLKSFNTSRHRAEYGVNFLGRTLVTDFENGNMYRLNPTTYTDNSEMIEREIIGEHWDSPDLIRDSIDKIRLDIETGVATIIDNGLERAPQIMLAVSKDRGRTWSSERWKSFGKLGEYLTKVDWNRWGRSRNWTFKLRMSDPVRFAVLGAVVNPTD